MRQPRQRGTYGTAQADATIFAANVVDGGGLHFVTLFVTPFVGLRFVAFFVSAPLGGVLPSAHHQNFLPTEKASRWASPFSNFTGVPVSGAEKCVVLTIR